eukprot:PITA_34308
MLLIEETMHDSLESITYFRRVFPSWHMIATNAVGLFGGQAVLWDPKWITVVAFQCFAGILLLAHFHNSPGPVHILNVYAPYKYQTPFWDLFLSSELLELDSLLIGGDSNCTLCNDEIWGNGRKNDPVGGLICDAIIQHNFVDVQSISFDPTWDNGQSNEVFLAKRLDSSLLHDRLIDRFGSPSVKIIPSFISNHRPISIHWNYISHRYGYPFKFNHIWHADEHFNKSIHESWHPPSLSEHDPPRPFLDQLSTLRKGVKRFANKRQEANTIWEIKNEEGISYTSQEAISEEAVKYFKHTYSRNVGCDIEDIFWGIDPYPTMFDANQNNILYSAVFEEELLATMKYFQKDKCPGPDGWTIDFFIHFFDLFKSDILNLVEESRTHGFTIRYISSTYIALIPKKKDSLTFMDYRAISPCNVLYKIVSKIIAVRLRNILSNHLSLEQHGFLKGLQHVGSCGTHSRMSTFHALQEDRSCIIKIDLKKAYDCVDWGFI